MFQGKNEIHLNETTIIEAMQEYFDKRLNVGFKVKVESVKAQTTNEITEFEVIVSDEKGE